jgi:competence protein ComEC
MPLLWISIAFLLGIVLASRLTLLNWMWIILAGGAVLLAVLETRLKYLAKVEAWLRRWIPLPVGILLLGVFLGAVRYQMDQSSSWTEKDLAWYNDSNPITFYGVVQEPFESGSDVIRVIVAADEMDGKPPTPLRGRALIYLPAGSGAVYKYGDRLEISGLPKTPPDMGAFSYRDYLARQGIDTIINYPIIRFKESDQGSLFMKYVFALRQYAYETINAIFPQPEASLMAGILLGIDRDIPSKTYDAFRATGTAHIIAISGFNIAILAGLFAWLASRVFRRMWSPLLAIFGIIFYTILVGAGASVVRAAIMGTIGLMGGILGRSQAGVNTLAFAGGLMAVMNPLVIWDPGFQLSFTATLGLILFADPLQAGFTRLAERFIEQGLARRLSRPVGEFLLFTLAAQITTMPVTAFHFGRLSLSAMVANPLILPPQALLMVLGGMVVLIGMVLPSLGHAFALLVWPLPAYTIRTAELLARLPADLSVFNFNMAWVILFYAGLALLVWKGREFLGRWRSALPNTLIFLLCMFNLYAWQLVFSRPDGRLHLTLLRVEAGPALFIRTPSGNTVLLGGGSSGTEVASMIARYLPIGRRSLDLVILDGMKTAPLIGLETLMNGFTVSSVLTGETGDTRTSKDLLAWVDAARIPRSTLQEGQGMVIDEDVILEPVQRNKEGYLYRLKMENLDVLITMGTFTRSFSNSLQSPPFDLLILGSGKVEENALTSLRNSTIAVGSRPLVPDFGNTPAQWINWNEYSWIDFSSDGQRLWVEGAR